MEITQEMKEAFDNYFALANVLHDDLSDTLQADYDNDTWRRNQIRMFVAMTEAYSHCFREIVSVGLKCDHPEMSKNEKAFSAPERIKYTLKSIHKIFELEPTPEFGGNGWNMAKTAIEKRGALMHPKSVSDLEITEEFWRGLHEGFTWLLDSHFNVVTLMSNKYISNAR